MKLNRTITQLGLTAALTALIAGCAQQQQGQYQKPAAAPAAAPMESKPQTSGRDYGPAYASYKENGMTYIKGSMAFPTGMREGSGLLIEKIVPAEVLAGQQFEYIYKVINLTDYPLENVVLQDQVSANFNEGDADPKATEITGGKATWQLGSLGGKETKMIHVKGSAKDVGTITTCGWASYTPQICGDIKVVKASIQLTKTEPTDVLVCDPIPVTLVVKNTGSSGLSGVKVTDTLPNGLMSDGKTSLTFDAGNLAPDQSKEFKFNAAATATGKYDNTAKATSDQNVSADAAASTTVHQPVLALSCKAREQQYMGRSFDVCFTLANTGDAPAATTTVSVPIPTGLNFATATAGGHVAGNSVVWDVGSLAVNAPQQLCATFTSANAGTFAFNGSAKGACAAPVSTSCETRVVGIAAILLEKADDPDPVAVGDTTTYTVKITNQGSADDNHVQVVVTIAPELVPVSAAEGSIDGQVVTFPVVPTLAPKAAVTYKIVAKGVKAGDGHTKFKLSSDVLTSPISAEESTTVY